MADGCCGKTRVDVDVKVRPLKGYWLPKNVTNSQTTLPEKEEQSETSRVATSGAISGVTLVSSQEVVYKKDKDDRTELKCLWSAESNSHPISPPKPSTPLSSKRETWGKPLLTRGKGESKKKTPGVRKALSMESASDYRQKIKTLNEGRKKGSEKSKKTASSCRCQCSSRRKRGDPKTPEETSVNSIVKPNKDLAKKNSEVKIELPKPPKIPPVPKAFPDPIGPQNSSGREVAVEPDMTVSPRIDDHMEGRSELKWWAVLAIFWIVLMIYREMATNE